MPSYGNTEPRCTHSTGNRLVVPLDGAGISLLRNSGVHTSEHMRDMAIETDCIKDVNEII